MKVLFDQGVPVPLRIHLPEHHVSTVYEWGWSTLENGDLIHEAENSEIEVFVTTDKNLKYQQNLASRKIAIVVLGTTSWPKLQKELEPIALAIAKASIGSYIEL